MPARFEAPSRAIDRRSTPRRAAPSFGSVLHINEKGGSFGGTEEYIALLTAALSARGVRSHVACGVVAGAMPSGFDSIHIVDGLASRQSQATTPGAVADVVSAVTPDVTYLHNVFDPAVVEAVVKTSAPSPVLWYVHDHYTTCLTELRWRRDIGPCPHPLGSGCLAAIDAGHCVRRHRYTVLDTVLLHERTALAHTLSAVDAVVVVSDYMRRLLLQAEPTLAARLHRITRPVRQPTPRRRPLRQHSEDPTIIVCAGRITAEKGQAVVIEAAGALRSRGPVELRIAGVIEDNAYWTRCLRLQRRAMSRNPQLSVAYLGHLDYDAIDEVFADADIITVPSQWPEPLGAVAVEAMAAGAVVVASDIGGLADIITNDHNGIRVQPNDVTAWTTAIGSLIDSPQQGWGLVERAAQHLAASSIDAHVLALDHIISTHQSPAESGG